jgi:hypothetical protein
MNKIQEKESKDGKDLKKIAVIVPSEESRQLYNSYLIQYKGFTLLPFDSLEAFNHEAGKVDGCDGFIIDLRAILKADDGEREYFRYLMDIFPAVRITHSPDKKSVTGEVRGRTLRNKPLFDFFFDELFAGSANGYKTIVLIVNDEESRRLYQSFLVDYLGINFIYYASAADFLENVSRESKYSGFIIDLRTMMKARTEDKDLFHELIDSFPAMRISHSLDKTVVKGNIRDRHLQDQDLFDYFIDDLCRHFIPRGIRTQRRRELFLNVRMEFPGKENDLTGNGVIKTNTVNVSEEGGFVLGTTPVKKGDKFQLMITELADSSPIQCVVKWVLPWGLSAHHLPGFGARFTGIAPGQKLELLKLLRRSM